MYRSLSFWVVVVALAFVPFSCLYGQMAGSRAVMAPGDAESTHQADLPPLDPKIAEGYITVDGSAEVRVPPTEIRIVLAVTAEDENAQKCRESIDATIARLKASWAKMETPPEEIVVDFIAVVPRYSWSMEKRENTQVGIEKKIGYRMQTNIHLAVRNDVQAQAALNRAFEQGVADILAFDYWSKDLDSVKIKVRQQAIEAARGKADVLLALFPNRPPIINVQEKTTVRYPESLYHTFSAQEEDSVWSGWNGNTPFIRASRPRQTYYRGLFGSGDIQPRDLPMKPEISVISTVRLYFQSPAEKGEKKEKSASEKTKTDSIKDIR